MELAGLHKSTILELLNHFGNVKNLHPFVSLCKFCTVRHEAQHGEMFNDAMRATWS